MICPYCGKQLKPDMKFCAGCGKPVAQSVQNQADSAQSVDSKDRRKKNLPLIITAVILVIAVIISGCVVGFDLFRNNREKDGALYIDEFPVLKQQTDFTVYDPEKFPTEEYKIKVERMLMGGILRSEAFRGETVIEDISTEHVYNINFEKDGDYRITLTDITAQRTQTTDATTQMQDNEIIQLVIIVDVKVDNDDPTAIDKVDINAGNGSMVEETTTTAVTTETTTEAVDLTEEFRKVIEEKATKEIVYFVTDDFDNDGKTEAFALDGEKSVDFYNHFPYATQNCTVWFVDERLNPVRVADQNLAIPDTGKIKGYGFLILEFTAGGSGSTSYVFGVKDNEPYELKISGMYQGFDIENEKCTGITHDFSEGYHKYIDNEFIFNEKDHEFYMKDAVNIEDYLSESEFTVSGKELAGKMPDMQLDTSWGYNDYQNEIPGRFFVQTDYGNDEITFVGWDSPKVFLYGCSRLNTYGDMERAFKENGYIERETPSFSRDRMFIKGNICIIVSFYPNQTITEKATPECLSVRIE